MMRKPGFPYNGVRFLIPPFTMDFLRNMYEENIKELSKKYPDKVVNAKGLNPYKLAKYLYETFRDYLPRDEEVLVFPPFFRIYFKEFNVEPKLIDDEGDFYLVEPNYTYEAVYLYRFDDFEDIMDELRERYMTEGR